MWDNCSSFFSSCLFIEMITNISSYLWARPEVKKKALKYWSLHPFQFPFPCHFREYPTMWGHREAENGRWWRNSRAGGRGSQNLHSRGSRGTTEFTSFCPSSNLTYLAWGYFYIHNGWPNWKTYTEKKCWHKKTPELHPSSLAALPQLNPETRKQALVEHLLQGFIISYLTAAGGKKCGVYWIWLFNRWFCFQIYSKCSDAFSLNSYFPSDTTPGAEL